MVEVAQIVCSSYLRSVCETSQYVGGELHKFNGHTLLMIANNSEQIHPQVDKDKYFQQL
jgi:hypothetical protein